MCTCDATLEERAWKIAYAKGNNIGGIMLNNNLNKTRDSNGRCLVHVGQVWFRDWAFPQANRPLTHSHCSLEEERKRKRDYLCLTV